VVEEVAGLDLMAEEEGEVHHHHHPIQNPIPLHLHILQELFLQPRHKVD
jgi:hypothetical protein